MIHSVNRKKACEYFFEKQNYIRHLDRLVKLKQGTSLEQIKKTEQQKRLADTMNKMRKIHQQNRYYRRKEMKQIEKISKSIDFSKVKSIIKQQINRPLLEIVQPHKHEPSQLQKQNLRLLERICKTKPCINVSSTNLSPSKQKQLSQSFDNDFSILYKQKQEALSNIKPIKFSIKLGKNKNLKKGSLKLSTQSLNQIATISKDDQSLYIMEFICGKYKARTPFIDLKSNTEHNKLNISIKYCEKQKTKYGIIVKLIKLIEFHGKERQIVKNSFNLQSKDENQEVSTSKKKSKQFILKAAQSEFKMPRFNQTVHQDHMSRQFQTPTKQQNDNI